MQLLKFMFICFAVLVPGKADTGLEKELGELETNLLDLEEGYDKKAGYPSAQSVIGASEASTGLERELEEVETGFLELEKGYDKKASNRPAQSDYIGYHYFGCYQDKRQRILQGKLTRSADMTIDKCMQICRREGDYYAGVEYANECYCGKHLMRYKKLGNSECSMACAGNSGQKCGEAWKISVYTTAANFGYVGCYKDKSARILEGKETRGDMTLQKCIQICTFEGDYYAGVEYGGECFCGKYLKPYEKVGNSECSTDCTGNPDQKCGGAWRISVYTTYVNYLGCYKDNPARILEGPVAKYHRMTTEFCINFCKKFGKRFALTEASFECFCGNHLKPSTKLKDSDCDRKCEGANSECCGGSWKGSLYFLQ